MSYYDLGLFAHNNMSKSLFLVTSAIYTRFGVYNTNQRLQQTLETLKSIKKFCDADIILLDAGQKNLSISDKSEIKKYAIDILEFSQEPVVQSYQKIDNWDVVKSALEILIVKSTFIALLNQPELLGKYSRIFKISGRYVLNSSFNYEQHLLATDKITIKKAQPSLYYTNHWVIQEAATEYYNQYMTRLWSFDCKMLLDIKNAYQLMQDDLMNLINKSRFIDIERLMYRHLDKSKIIEFPIIGVQGNIAPNGVVVTD